MNYKEVDISIKSNRGHNDPYEILDNAVTTKYYPCLQLHCCRFDPDNYMLSACTTGCSEPYWESCATPAL